MLATDRDALLCDLAETYHLYDYRQLPPRRVAVLASGLRETSRSKAPKEGTLSTQEVLLAGILDRLSLLVWFQTADGMRGRRCPPSVLDALTGRRQQRDTLTFASGQDFLRAWDALTER
jgi:hypothetical protein